MIAALLVSLLLSPGEQEPHPAPRVLVLYSTNRLVPATARFDNRFRADLGTKVADADFFTEFLDLSREQGAEAEARLAHLLHARYRDRPPSVVVAGGLPSSLFVARHRADLFPGAALVYGGVPSLALPTLPVDSLTAAVQFDYPVRQTAELIARTLPSLHEIVVLSGDGPPDQRLLADARVQLAGWSGPPLRFISDRAFDSLAAYAGGLKPGTALLLLSFDHDPGGRPWEASAFVAERLSHAAAVPTFGPSDTYVGRGITGGSMRSLDDLSPSVADVVIQILAGVSPAAVKTRPILVRAVFDARELERWHIDSRALPPGAEVRFAPVSSLTRHRPTLIVVSVSALAVATLFVLIVVERRRRQRADAAQSTMGVMAGALAHELGQPITAQQLNATAALELLGSGQLDPEHAHALLTNIANAAGRASDIATAIRQLLQTRELRREPVALDALVIRTVPSVFADTTSEVMRVALDLTHEIVLGDAILLQQVVFNLLLNAREAVEQIAPDQGVITIRTAREGHSTARLEVIDSGPGISADAELRVFEPFFTSKPNGLGLGLSLCRLIVESHGGTLVIERSDERGARLVARLPIAPATSEAVMARSLMEVKPAG